tara:strand:+ start:658 stop:1287 length:630 start_codon:yes stop_codon:yes gene_type:complete
MNEILTQINKQKYLVLKNKKNKYKDIHYEILLAIKNISQHKTEIENLKHKLENRKKDLTNKLNSIQMHNDKKYIVYEDEYAEINNALESVTNSEISLLKIIVRLESLSVLGDSFYHMEKALDTFNELNKSIVNLVPDLEKISSDLNESIINTLHKLGSISSPDGQSNHVEHTGNHIIKEIENLNNVYRSGGMSLQKLNKLSIGGNQKDE